MTTTIPSPTSTSRARVTRAASESTARLSLGSTPDRRRGLVDGGWWPRSRDATAELPALIAAVDRRLGRKIFRINLGRTAWDNIPRRISLPGRTVKVAWFRTIDPAIVSLTIAGAENLILLVIPPDTPAATAHNALALSSVTPGDLSPVDVLSTAHAMTLAETRQHHRNAEAGWDNEGGHVWH